MVDLEPLAYALWYMFAIGSDANRWDDRARGAWIQKAERVMELREKRIKQLETPGPTDPR